MKTNQTIAERAYELWNARGRPHGSPEEDWREAERQLSSPPEADDESQRSNSAIDTSLEETFPASDPTASHIPDVPPSNAQDKWDAAAKVRATAESE
jgi:hypothetical protein